MKAHMVFFLFLTLSNLIFFYLKKNIKICAREQSTIFLIQIEKGENKNRE
jgi:hypothetical protein